MCEFRKILRENPDLENEFCSQPYIRTSPINIRDALCGGRTEAIKTWYRVKQGKKSVMWILLVFTPTFVNMASFLWVTRKFTWV